MSMSWTMRNNSVKQQQNKDSKLFNNSRKIAKDLANMTMCLGFHLYDHICFTGYSHLLDACCGAGPRYPFGFNSTAYFCTNETEALYVCPNPVNFISWDGSHFTEGFNFQVFNLTFVHGLFMHTAGAASRARFAGLNVSKSEAWA